MACCGHCEAVEESERARSQRGGILFPRSSRNIRAEGAACTYRIGFHVAFVVRPAMDTPVMGYGYERPSQLLDVILTVNDGN